MEEQLDLAKSDPVAALARGFALLDDLKTTEHSARSQVLRSLGIAARTASTMKRAVAFGRASVTEARLAGDPDELGRTLMTLAGTQALAGLNTEAGRTIAEAGRVARSDLLSAQIEFQRAAILLRLGEPMRAEVVYTAILPVFTAAGDDEFTRMTLSNRALARRFRGDTRGATADLLAARSLYEQAGVDIEVAYTDHNLGWVSLYQGDIPQALELFDRSERLLASHLDSAVEVQVSRCEALLSAGLFREALDLSTKVARDMKRAGLGEDEAEAWLMAAQAGVLAGEVDQGLLFADRAAERFGEQRRAAWQAMARQVALQAQFDTGSVSRGLAGEARSVARTLERKGQLVAAERARLLAGRIALALGHVESALRDLAVPAARRSGPAEARIQSWFATALMRSAVGNSRGADAAARAGMNVLDAYQTALGATDIRLGIERHGRELASLGLRLAIESRDPRRVFGWIERGRGRSLVNRPVKPPTDEWLAGAMAELRQVAADLRAADREAASALARRQDHLQELIRDRVRHTRGAAKAVARVGPAAVADALGDQTLIEMTSAAGQLSAIIVEDARFRLRKLAAEADVKTELHSLRFNLRRLARGRGSASIAQEVARRLDGLLFGSLPLKDGPLVIVPTPELHAVPWWTLPSCRDRAVTVSPSAELWYRAQQPGTIGTGSMLAAGPDLELSDIEVAELAAVDPKATVLSSARASVEAVLSHLDGARMAHIASHAFFQFENPMFSSLRLADGDLNVYDIERLGSAPHLVVLSACDSGFTDTHAGEELMGLSSALLSMGTRSIIASVGLVPDSTATKDLMVWLHRGLVSGLSPAHALHQAQGQASDTPKGYVAASSFICIGAG